MTWFKRHLNITWLIALVLPYLAVRSDSPVPYIVTATVYYAVTLWVLHRKGRSLAWVFIAIVTPFLDNHRERENQRRIDADTKDANTGV